MNRHILSLPRIYNALSSRNVPRWKMLIILRSYHIKMLIIKLEDRKIISTSSKNGDNWTDFLSNVSLLCRPEVLRLSRALCWRTSTLISVTRIARFIIYLRYHMRKGNFENIIKSVITDDNSVFVLMLSNKILIWN